MAKTLLFTGFRSRHDLRFLEEHVNTSVFLRSSRQTIGPKSAKNAVIYKGLAPSRAKNCVNTSVSASKSGQTFWFTVFRAFHVFLKLQKSYKDRHFLRSTRQDCRNLQCVFLLCFQKRWYLQGFVHLWSKKCWYLHHFLRFRIVPAIKDVKTQKCCNLQIL